MTRHPVALLSAALLLSLLGPAPAGASATRSGRVSAHLTKTTFTAAQAARVKLVYKVTRTSTRVTCVLSRRRGTRWLKLRSVSRRVPARSTRSLTVKQLFGGKAIAAARYRVKVSTRANGVTLRFTVTRPSPRAGSWRSTSLGGATGFFVHITGVSFTVSSAGVSRFTLAYFWSTPTSPVGGTCSGSDTSFPKTSPAPITGGSFTSSSLRWPSGIEVWSGRGSEYFSGTFDSATKAHGTASLSWMIGVQCNPSSGTTGPFTWTAAWQGP